MFKIILLISAYTVACQGDPIPATTRFGDFNKYYLYTRENPRIPIELPVLESPPNPIQSKPRTAVVVHGHKGSATTTLNPHVKDDLLMGDDINVIVVDWSIFASLSYSNAVNAVPAVGKAIGEFLSDISVLFPLETIHLVGFGLGAHVVGFTGRELNGQVARITGLDPTSSQWGNNSPRLRRTDARYVEVIHTDGDGLTSNGLGTAIGVVDFFPNGGGYQPGCVTHSCSHNRAWELFAATQTHELIGNQCNSKTQVNLNLCRGRLLAMGNNQLDKLGSGMYRVNTRKSFPY